MDQNGRYQRSAQKAKSGTQKQVFMQSLKETRQQLDYVNGEEDKLKHQIYN